MLLPAICSLRFGSPKEEINERLSHTKILILDNGICSFDDHMADNKTKMKLLKRILGYFTNIWCTRCGERMIETGYRGWVKCLVCSRKERLGKNKIWQ